MIEIFKIGFDSEEELTKWLDGKPGDKLADIMQYLAEESVVNIRKLKYLRELNERISEEVWLLWKLEN